jgi:hypothetical protein
MLIIGKNREDAKAKYETALKYTNPTAGLAQFSGYTGIDMSWLNYLRNPVCLQSCRASVPLEALNKTGEPCMPRRLLERISLD